MTLNRSIIAAARILPTDSKKTILHKLGLSENSANIKTATRAQEFVNNSEDYNLHDSIDLRRRVIAEYHCKGFYFVTSVPYAEYAVVVYISKEMLLQYASEYLRPSIVQNGEMKRDEAGKPCYRFNLEALRREQALSKVCVIDFQGMSWTAFCKKFRKIALRNNIGCYFESLLAEKLGYKDIGEIDRLSHTHHTDLLDEATGEQYEVKVENGYISSQFWTALHEWKK